MKKFIAVIQARMTSTRLPGKVMKKVKGKHILDYVLEGVKTSKCDDIIVCTTENETDDSLEEFCLGNKIRFSRGDEFDVLGRILNAIKNERNSTAVRITADNPLVDPAIINYLIDIHVNHKNSVTENYFTKSFPNGTVLSLIDYAVLDYMDKNFHEKSIREHIVFGFDKLPKKYTVENVRAPKQWNRPDIRFCIDYEKDLELFEKITESFEITGDKPSTIDLIKFIDENKDIKEINYEYAKKGY